MSSLPEIVDNQPRPHRPGPKPDTVFGYPRDFQNRQFVYLVVSPRAGGLSIGLNLNPDRNCNFDCIYCEVDRSIPSPVSHLNVDQMADELRSTLDFVRSGKVSERPYFQRLPRELLSLRHVTISGDGEPTLCEQFLLAVQTVVQIRTVMMPPAFKLVLLTNGSGLDREQVISGLKYFTGADEIWCKLDGGTPRYLQTVNRPQFRFEQAFQNILALARQRPLIIQSLFPAIDGTGPSGDEIESYLARLEKLRAEGAKISLVQIYSATRPMHNDQCGHLPLRTLSKIAQLVRQRTGFRAEVF